MNDEELLAEAKRKYPIGTKFISFNDGNRIRTVNPYAGKKTVTWKICGKDVRSYNGLYTIADDGDGACSNPLIYCNGKWAKIVSVGKLAEEYEIY